jgi:hypothetical protein
LVILYEGLGFGYLIGAVVVSALASYVTWIRDDFMEESLNKVAFNRTLFNRGHGLDLVHLSLLQFDSELLPHDIGFSKSQDHVTAALLNVNQAKSCLGYDYL